MKFLLSTLLILLTLSPVMAQQGAGQDKEKAKIVVENEEVSLNVGQTLQLAPKVVTPDGTVLKDSVEFIYFTRPRAALSVDDNGLMEAFKAGEHTVYIIRPQKSETETRLIKQMSVSVPPPPIERITFNDMPEKMYQGTSMPLDFTIVDISGENRNDDDFTLTNSKPEHLQIGKYHTVKALETGKFEVEISMEDKSATWKGKIVKNPVTSIDLEVSEDQVRTGDVVKLSATALDKKEKSVDDAPITYSFKADTKDQDLGRGTAAQIAQDGRFVANKPGIYTLIAKMADRSAEETIKVTKRNVQGELVKVGHGKVSDKHTSDLWVWEGIDGRDYAITGTWGADGMTYFWDVTDPSDMKTIDTVQVDARTVNDVKISEDGTVGVITREGASDRKNGIVILDVTDPSNVSIITEYTDGLTGGVHNSFIYEDHVYAVNNGTRYDIINIEDPANPYRVSRFELDTPGHAIHDVWIEDGIAYSSNWQDGVVAVDVGSNERGISPEDHNVESGSPENPQKLGSYAYPSGWNHAAFPFKSESTGDFYVVAGDEAFPNGLGINTPTIPAGWMHFIKFDDWNNPKEVARYKIPEAGTHNYWIEGDTLYIAYYNAGLRVVDISGELMGNLYNQGREIAHFKTFDPEGVVPNAPMAWGPQPYKGHIFVSDWNSGLWAFKLKKPKPTARN